MTNALSAFGSLLKIGDGGGTEVFTTIAEVRDIKGPKLKTNTKDVTNQSSPSGAKEIIATILEAGEVSFGINFIPTNATHSQSTGLIKDWKNRTKRNFQLVFPDSGSTTWAFAAYVTGVDLSEPVDGELGGDVTLSITGMPTLAG